MPSRYEPCGLTQMYALAYGTVPVVRRTGGLADSIIGLHGENLDWATGFHFDDPSPHALAAEVLHAQNVFFHRDTWSRAHEERDEGRLLVGPLGQRLRARLPARAGGARAALVGIPQAGHRQDAGADSKGASVRKLIALVAKQGQAGLHDHGIEAALPILLDIGKGEVQSARRAVRPMAGHRLDDVGHGEDARAEGDLLSPEPLRIAGAVLAVRGARGPSPRWARGTRPLSGSPSRLPGESG